MIIIGERLNSANKNVYSALKRKDVKYILKEARQQKEAGADYLDLNTAALLEEEIEAFSWVIPLIQKELEIPLSLDTPDFQAMEKALHLHKGQAFLNSITGEKEKLKVYFPLIKKYKPKVIALCLDERGLPSSPEVELEVARFLVSELTKGGVAEKDIFLDPLVRPVGLESHSGMLFLQSLKKIKEVFPGINTIAGISNISFGLPQRKLLNRTLLVMACFLGLDSAIVDPLDHELMSSLFSSQAILGQDKYCSAYLQKMRKK